MNLRTSKIVFDIRQLVMPALVAFSFGVPCAHAVLSDDFMISGDGIGDDGRKFAVQAENHLVFTGSSAQEVQEYFDFLTLRFGTTQPNNGSVDGGVLNGGDLGFWAANLGTTTPPRVGARTIQNVTVYEGFKSINTFLYVAAWGENAFRFNGSVNGKPVVSNDGLWQNAIPDEFRWEACTTDLVATHLDTKTLLEEIEARFETCPFKGAKRLGGSTPWPDSDRTGGIPIWAEGDGTSPEQVVVFRHELIRHTKVGLSMTTERLENCAEVQERFGSLRINCKDDSVYAVVTVDPPRVKDFQLSLKFGERMEPVFDVDGELFATGVIPYEVNPNDSRLETPDRAVVSGSLPISRYGSAPISDAEIFSMVFVDNDPTSPLEDAYFEAFAHEGDPLVDDDGDFITVFSPFSTSSDTILRGNQIERAVVGVPEPSGSLLRWVLFAITTFRRQLRDRLGL